MTLNKMGVFTFDHSNQQDDLYKAMSATEVKQAFDSRGEELKTTLNTLIDSLQSSVNGDSGAKFIGVETIPGLSGNDVRSLFVALKNQMDSTVLGQIPDGAVTKPKLDPTLLANLIDYATTTGSANTYVITLNPAPTSYTDGMAVSVKINVDAIGATTLNINGLGAIPLKKSNGSDVTNLKTNGVYTFRYNSSTGNFILQGEGGSGTATAGDILTGKTATTDAGDVTGTMANRGAMTITPGTTDQIIPAGYHNGSGKVPGDPDLIPANIKSGANILGVDGSLPVMIAGDTVFNTNDGPKFNNNTTPTKILETKVTFPGTYRVKFDHYSAVAGQVTYARVYVNGVAKGITRSRNADTLLTETEDFTLQTNDLVQIYTWNTSGTTGSYAQTFRLCGTPIFVNTLT